MSTRSLTHIVEAGQNDNKPLLTFYRQMDGYPSGHGKELAEFLAKMKIVNGFGMGDKPGEVANGVPCLTAQVLTHFKKDSLLGGIYVYPAGSSDCGEEYVYTVTVKDGKIRIKVEEPTYPEGYGDGKPVVLKQLYEGTAANALKWCAKQS